MRAFRIDNRDYDVDGVIAPQDLYQGQLNAARVQVEEILEANRPDEKPRRNQILMLFERFDDAKKHWTIQAGSKFYRTEIQEDDILHIGDYNKVEELYANLANPERAIEIAQEYWNGIMTENPKREIFVNEATVTHVLSNSDQERKNAYRIRGNFEPIPGVRIIIDQE